MRIDRDVPIEMSDGIVLRADVFMPAGGGSYPVLLSYGPYAKGLSFAEGYPAAWERLIREHPDVIEGSTGAYQNWEVADPEKWVPDGYACVRVDSRGAGRSPGLLDLFSPQEAQDLYECIEWAGTQEWSSGRVGLSGISYYAINQWHVAGRQPPHLTAMIPWEGAADWYRDMTHQGGILTTFWRDWYDMQVTNVQHGVGDRGPVNPSTGEPVAGPSTLTDDQLRENRTDLGAMIATHPLDDEYHRARSAQWDRITVPFLSSGNWGGHGLHLRGNIEAFTQAASPEKWLEVHGLEHWTHYYTSYGLDLQKRFFGHYLKGEDTGWDTQPRVWLQIRHVDKFVARAEDTWPIARTDWQTLHLDAETMSLSTSVPISTAVVSFRADADGLDFATAPFDDETEITGPLAARLSISSSSDDADLFLVLKLLSESGEEIVFQGALDPHSPIAQGWLRASHRKLDPTKSRPDRPYHTHERKEPLVPGEIYVVDVELWPTSIVVPADHRLVLTVQGRDYEYPGAEKETLHLRRPLRGSGPFLHDDIQDRPPSIREATVRIHTGGGKPCHLVLPVIPET